MKGKNPDYRLMTSRDKRSGEGKIYTTIGAAWIVDKGAISVQFEALPMSRNAVLFPFSDSDAEGNENSTAPDFQDDVPF